MFRLIAIAVLTLCSAVPALAQITQPDSVRFKEVRVIEGDDISYASFEYDDSQWDRFGPHDVDPQQRLIWIRAHIDGERLNTEAAAPLGFFLSVLASRQVYFNGVLIGASGNPGATPEDETPGALDAVYYIPPDLIRDQNNVIAIRMSSHHLGARLVWPVHNFHIAEYEPATERRLEYAIPAIAASGAIALGAFYFLGFFAFNRRDGASLALGVLAFSVVGQLAAEAWRAFDYYQYPLHMLRLYLMIAFAVLAGGALSTFASLRFAPHRLVHISIAAAALAAIAILVTPGYDGKTGFSILVFMTAALIAALIGARNGKAGARLSAIGFGLFLAAAFAAPLRFLDQTYYVAMAALILVLFATQIRLLGNERRAREEAALQTVRLRHELLKKQIQPHFLMNTLTTLSEWIESDPKTGVVMIDALSQELRLLYDISDKKLISLEDELELCRQHLQVMSLRADAEFTLQSDADAPNIQCPPAVLLTLIENAFTHNEYRSDAAFKVNATLSGDAVSILCRAPIQNTGKRTSQNGAGLAYIRARLKEAFGDAWSLQSAQAGENWETTITWRLS